MKISSKLKKIMSFLLVLMLMVSSVVLPVSADETTEEAEKYTPMYDLSNAYFTDSADLEYTGVRSDNLTLKFNVRQEYDMSFTMQDYYFCRAFNLTTYDGRNPVTMFAGDKLSYGDMFSLSYLQTATASFFEKNNLSLTNYDVYYYACTGRQGISGIFDMYYYLVPKGRRIAITNARGPQFDNGEGVWGIYSKSSSFACLNNNDASMSIVYVHRRIDANYNEITDDVNFVKTCTPPNAYIKDEAYYYKFEDKSFITGLYQQEAVCSNIPVFRSVEDAGLYVNEIRDPVADNKAPVEEQEPEEEKVGADAFFWDSLKCRIVESGECYKLIFDYSYSAKDMVENFNSYQINVDMTQSAKYKVSGDNNIYTYTNKDYHSSLNIGKSPGSAVDQASMLSFQTWGAGGTILRWGLQAWSDFWGTDRDWTAVNFINSYIYVYVELVHVQSGGNGLFIKDKVSSDIRTFKFDALTLESLDNPEEITPDVKVDEVKDSNGNVVDKKVSQVVVNDNSTHQTINNYYYDSDGNKKESSGSAIGDSLSNIASGLVKFIKTLVTEGLPAALEILKSLIKTISDLLGFIGDQIGDIGQGTQNGIIAVLKAIPVPLWGICSVALIVFVIVGVLKHIF